MRFDGCSEMRCHGNHRLAEFIFGGEVVDEVVACDDDLPAGAALEPLATVPTDQNRTAMDVVEAVFLATGFATGGEECATGAVVADGVPSEKHIRRPSRIFDAPTFGGIQFWQWFDGGDAPALRAVLGGRVHGSDGLDGPFSGEFLHCIGRKDP